MEEIYLILGPIAFRGFEIPAAINFGGRQRLALHRLPGGSRVVDALGRDDAQITFAGIFNGSDATLRARSVDGLRVMGLPLPLTWDVFFYTVLISEFWADYRNSSWIPYRVVCTVLQDEASALLQEGVAIAAAALTDVVSAAAYAADAGLDLGLLTAALSTPSAATRGTAAYVSAQASMVDTQLSMESMQRSADQSLANASAMDTGSAQSGITSLQIASDASLQLSSLANASAFLRRASLNVANASI